MRERTRVAVTGIGLVTSLGTDRDEVWAGLVSGAPTAGPIKRFEPEGLKTAIACEVDGFDPAAHMERTLARRLDRATQFAVAAGTAAVRARGGPPVDPERCGIVVGTGIGGLESAARMFGGRRGPARTNPYTVPMIMPNAAAAELSIQLGWTGPSMTVALACASGAAAIGEAARLIWEGEADLVCAGGTEAPVARETIEAFGAMGALSVRNEDPGAASRPFDADRDGFVLGEGAAFVVLERVDGSQSASALGEVLAYAANSDAFHIAAPHAEGLGAERCMRRALERAGLSPADIGHVNAHGTSTALNDYVESLAIGRVFGEGGVSVTSTKGVTGHLLGATGALEFVFALEAAVRGIVPPTANFRQAGEGIAADVVAEAREVEPAPFLTNSFAFGGHNVTLIGAPWGRESRSASD